MTATPPPAPLSEDDGRQLHAFSPLSIGDPSTLTGPTIQMQTGLDGLTPGLDGLKKVLKPLSNPMGGPNLRTEPLGPEFAAKFNERLDSNLKAAGKILGLSEQELRKALKDFISPDQLQNLSAESLSQAIQGEVDALKRGSVAQLRMGVSEQVTDTMNDRESISSLDKVRLAKAVMLIAVIAALLYTGAPLPAGVMLSLFTVLVTLLLREGGEAIDPNKITELRTQLGINQGTTGEA